MTKGLMDDYRSGELSGLIFAGALSAQSVAAVANQSLRVAKQAPPSGPGALEMRRLARLLEDAAASLKAAADLAYSGPALMQAAE